MLLFGLFDHLFIEFVSAVINAALENLGRGDLRNKKGERNNIMAVFITFLSIFEETTTMLQG
jgi:hypothetical protein